MDAAHEPTLYLLCGKIAAGKSTLARRLAARPATLLISEDHWTSNLFYDDLKTIEDYGRCSARLRAAMGPHVVDILRQGLSIVLDFPANTVKELVDAAKADPGKIVFASPGFAATQHFAGELFKQIAGVNLLHVPFRSSPEAINAVLGKHADVLFDTVSAVIGQVQSGTLKALAVTGKDRFPAVPDIPAAAESGALPGYDVTTWYGVFGPPGMPAAVVEKLNKTLNEVIAEGKVREHLVAVGVVVKGSTAPAFGAFMAAEYKRWNAVREAAGIPQQ